MTDRPADERPDDERPDERPDFMREGDEPLDVVVPDDLSELDSPAESPSVALVVTQVAAAEPLAAACVLALVQVDVVPTPIGAVAVLKDPANAEAGAGAISKLLRTVPVVLLERREGQVSAARWAEGRRERTLPAGLVLSDAPPVVEDLLLGFVDVGSLPDVVTSVGISRWKAMRLLAGSARRKR